MNIVIFDDDILFIESMKKSLNELDRRHNGIFAEATYIISVSEIIAYVDANRSNASLYILDIMANSEPIGFTIAEYIKKVNKENLVIFITYHKGQILTDNMEHKMLALSFIYKESNKLLLEIECALLKVNEMFNNVFFIGECIKSFVRVKYEDIFYFKKNKYARDVTIVHRQGSDKINGCIKDIKKELNDHFIFVAREIIVNTQAVNKIDKIERIIFFENGKTCPYSVRRGKDLLNKCKLSLQ